MKQNHPSKMLMILTFFLLISLSCSFLNKAAESSDSEVKTLFLSGLDVAVTYQVNEDGEAMFWFEDFGDLGPLTSSVASEETALLAWKNVILDGYGELTPVQAETLGELFSSAYGQAVPQIILDLACREDHGMTDKQLAAIMFPWQLHLKYNPVNRFEEIERFISTSNCVDMDLLTIPVSDQEDLPVILISVDDPFPVVYGYFPFDPEGAFEHEDYADLDCPLQMGVLSKKVDLSLSAIPLYRHIPFNIFGPCNTRCRGACGRNCTTNNCSVEIVIRCIKNINNENTGLGIPVQRFTCGVHDGCIVHDACYDSCNRGYGCGSFRASWCKHGVLKGNCDGDSIAKYGLRQSLAWARGKGPFRVSWSFDYTTSGKTDESGVENFEACPPGEVEPTIEVTKSEPVLPTEPPASTCTWVKTDDSDAYPSGGVSWDMEVGEGDTPTSLKTYYTHGKTGCGEQVFETYHAWNIVDAYIPGQTVNFSVVFGWENIGTRDCASLVAEAGVTSLSVGSVQAKAQNTSINVLSEPSGSITRSAKWTVPEGAEGEVLTITQYAATGFFAKNIRWRYAYVCE